MALSEVDTMSMKELKAVIAEAGLSLDGCIEKPELRARAAEALSALAARAAAPPAAAAADVGLDVTTRRLITLEVRVPPPNQESLKVQVAPDETVAGLKECIAAQREGWSAEMNVILQGKFLDGELAVSECGLKDGAFVVVTGLVARKVDPPVYEYDAEAPLPPESNGHFSAPLVMNSLPTEQTIERT